MKIAIVSTGLLDSLLPLAKHLSEHVSLDLYISVYGEKFAESVGTFDLSEVPEGMLDEEMTARIVGPRLMEYVRENGGKVRLKLFRYPNLKIFNRRNFQLHREFANELNRNGYDLVHLNGYRGALMFLYAFLKRSTAKVWTVHDPVLHSGEEKWQTRLAYHSYRYLGAHFILHNKGQRPEFTEQYGISQNRCHFVPFGPLEVFKTFLNGQEIKEEPATVLFWGRISPYKGIEYLEEAALIAKRKVPKLKVIVAGKPNYPLNTSRLEEDPTFEFINGFVPNPELVKLIQRSSLVVCPYLDATQSGVLMTSYAFNKPVLATRVGGLPEAVEEGITGRLVPPKDAAALAEAMVEMLQDREQLKSMNRNIEKLKGAGRFSWDKIARETVKVYELALK